MPGSLTSRIRQLGPSVRGLAKKSCAVPKDLECRPTDSSNSWRDSRTSASSSTMNTVGTSCVLIPPCLDHKYGENTMSQASARAMTAICHFTKIVDHHLTNAFCHRRDPVIHRLFQHRFAA